jgi:choline dehydrogenase-like flavoprotein
MHIDARKLSNHSVIEGDICIIGAGAAGISLALEWMNTPYKVILLEGGGFDYDDQVQDLYAGKATGQRYFPLRSARLHYFGGTTNHWAGWCSTFDAIDLKKRDWVPHSGWPITRTDLDPFYPRAQRILDLGPYEYDMPYWQKQDKELRPLVTDEQIVWSKMWQFSPPTRMGPKYKNTIVGAKNIHLYTYANVVNITANEPVNAITEVTVTNHAGRQHTVRANQFILCCCSIQNARLLLAANQQAPKGLGNDNDLVGRFFMEHLEIRTGELWLDKPSALKLYAYGSGTKARAELAITEKAQAAHKILNGTLSLTPLYMAQNTKPIIEIWSDEDPRKNEADLHATFNNALNEKPPANSKLNQGFELFTRIEQAPNPDSRIILDAERDALGMPRAALHWELTPLEKRSIRKIHELLGQQVGRAGIGRVRLLDFLQDEKDSSWPDWTGAGWHHMGTTRMGTDPKQSVVDANCKVHGLANLYCAGASCYTTAAAVNPTLTLVALTLRLSDHLKQHASQQQNAV